MGLGSFVDINLFVMKYYFIDFLHIFHFLEPLKSKSTQMLRPQNGNLGVSFNNTLLNFGLRRIVDQIQTDIGYTQYSLKYRVRYCTVHSVQFNEYSCIVDQTDPRYTK